MTSREDLDKLFEAALHEKSAPSRFGTPESQVKAAPAAFTRQPAAPAAQPNAFQAAPPQGHGYASPQQFDQQQPQAPQAYAPQPQQYQPAPQHFQAAPPQQYAPPQYAEQPQAQKNSGLIDITAVDDQFANQAVKSMDSDLSAELGAILDAKVAKEKRKKRRGRIMALLILFGITGGSAGWVVTNPERYQAMKQVITDIKSASDIQGMVAKYQKALDKVAVRSEQIDAATESMGVDPRSADHMEDQGFDKEMREMMGEEGGPTTAERDKLLREKFQSVEEGGSLMDSVKE